MSAPSEAAYKALERELASARAAEAASAIENARLETAAREASRYQAASAEVLQVINSSVSDLQAVYDKILESCERLLDVDAIGAWTAEADGMVHTRGLRGAPEVIEKIAPIWPLPITNSIYAATVAERRAFNIPSYRLMEARPTAAQRMYEVLGDLSGLSVPMIVDGRLAGTLGAMRIPPRPFSDQDAALLQGFADQAAIAIQNARLFNETRTAQKHQAALGEVMRAMSESPNDAGPVFDVLLDRAIEISGAAGGFISRFDGEQLYPVARRGLSPEQEATFLASPWSRPHQPGRGSLQGRAILECRAAQATDIEQDADFTDVRPFTGHIRSGIAFPLLREGRPIGALSLGFAVAGPVADDTARLLQRFAEQAAIAIHNAQLFKDTQEALERQTATAEVLQVISKSPTDIQPVFDAIAARAAALCHAGIGTTSIFDGKLIHMVAVSGASSEQESVIKGHFPRPADDSSFNGRAVLSRAPVHIADAMEDFTHPQRGRAAQSGVRSIIAVPMVRDEVVVGVIAVTRDQPGLFSDPQVQLLQTFAAQAVIAIENARLFQETKEALEQQTATSEVLRVISSSVADAQPVFEKILDSCAMLFEVEQMGVTLLQDGQLHIKAARGEWMRAIAQTFPRPVGEIVNGQALLDARVVHIPDVAALGTEMTPSNRDAIERIGNHSYLVAPLIRDGQSVGGIGLLRVPPRPFTDSEIALLTTFADQAVIALENARLFRETQEALEQQTATAEVLKVISSSVADAQPVFDKILDSCQALFEVEEIVITRLDDAGQLHLSARRGTMTEVASKTMPIPVEESWTARAILERRTIHMPNAAEVLETAPSNVRAIYDLIGNFSGIIAPLLRDGLGIGSIGLWRVPPKPFSDKEVALLTTFADQAVIAIENARLFRETQEALELQTASSQILQVISTSMADARPVYETILDRSAQFLDANMIGIFVERDGEIHNVGFRGDTKGEAMIRHTWPAPAKHSTNPRLVSEQRLINIDNVGAGLADRPLTQQRCHEIVGDYSNVIAPMFWEGSMVGAICAFRYPPRPFSEKEANSLAGFAGQAAIAIQNARLFNETKEALEQQTATAEVLQVISTSMADAQPVFEKILDSAEKLIDGDFHMLFQVKDGQVHVVANRGEEIAQRFMSVFPISVEHTTVARAGLDAPHT